MATNSKKTQKKADEKRKEKRARAWQCVVYPDSAPEDWQDILRDSLIECLISPLHDKDKQEEDSNKQKKPHYHVILSWKNPVAYEKAVEIFDEIGGVYPSPEKSWDTFLRSCRVRNFQQAARYLCHLDQPNKYQYDTSEVESIGAIDYVNLVSTRADDDLLMDEIIDFIHDHHICNFMNFVMLVRDNKPEWKRIVYHQHASFFEKLIKGERDLEMKSMQ